jgi:hypothetical protein
MTPQRSKQSRSPRTWRIVGTAVVLTLAIASYRGLYAETDRPLNRLIDFRQYHYGAVPDEFDYDATGVHGPVLSAGRPFWRVYVDRFAPSPEFVIIQGAALAELDHYPIALLRDVELKDATLSVYLKPMGGSLGQSQGLIWRAQDKNNYYAVLANVLDGKLHLLNVVNGQAREIATAPIQIAVQFEQQSPGSTWGWYTLKVEVNGSRITVWFDDERLIETTDNTFPMFIRAGQVGLITHADSVTLFDDFHIQSRNNR